MAASWTQQPNWYTLPAMPTLIDYSTGTVIPRFEVVAAVIERGNRILCAQRKDKGELARKWEFPGGKIEQGETRQQALDREIEEELGIQIEIGSHIMTVEHCYTAFAIRLHTYSASITQGQPVMREHMAIRWLRREELKTLDWAPADLPVVERIMEQTACPFCRIPEEQRFYDGKLVFGIWDSHPVSAGHALLIPKRHVASWFDATREEQAELLSAVEAARAEIEKTRLPDGYNIGVNIGSAAGQTVFHLHVHVIPRYDGDVQNPRGGVRRVLPGEEA